MSSLRRVRSSKANGARSKGPSTPAGKHRSSLNAMRHGLCAKCIVIDGESRDNFLILLQQHIDRFRPASEVEFGMIEEMCAAYWRQRRAWSIETGMFNKQMAIQPGESMMERMAAAFETFAAAHSLSLLHRYENRLHLMYQRALRTLIMLRTIDPPNQDLPNDPSPISEHSDVAQRGTPSPAQSPEPEALASTHSTSHQPSHDAATDAPAVPLPHRSDHPTAPPPVFRPAAEPTAESIKDIPEP